MFEDGSTGEVLHSGQLSHDKVFKNLFEAFPEELVRLVNPRIAKALDFARAKIRTEPLLGNLGKSEHAIPDLVISAPLKNEETEHSVLLHFEIEAQHRATMERRMWRYFSLLNSRHDTEVFSVVIFLSGGPSGVEPRRYRLRIGNVEVNRFTYWAFGLSSCDAEQWLAKKQPLAAALAALMKVRGDRVEHKLRCLREAAKEKDRNRFYLLNLVISLYLRLPEAEEARFQAILAEEKAMLPAIPAIPLSLTEYENALARHAAEGKNLGLAEGKNLGLAEGKNLGLVEGQKQSIVHLLNRRFGAVPESLKARLETVADPARLQRLFDTALDAASVSQVEAALAG